MTTSSSSSSIVDDSPTHVSAHFGEQPRPKLDFSKSLPAGTLRPFALEPTSGEKASFETPQNYKSVKPLPAAFATTGLVSKVNRNPEEPQLLRGGGKNVPDTPCKKHVNAFATYPAPVLGSAIAKARHIRHSFGNPSTPFNPHGNQTVQGTFGKGTGVFGSAFGNNGLTRRGSFLSVDGDDSGGSPEAKGDSQSSNDYELPPTPTKHALAHQQNNGSPSIHRSFPASAVGYGMAKKLARTSSKLNLFTSPGDPDAEDSDASMDMNDSPTTAHGRVALRPSDSAPTLSRSTAPFISPRKPGFAKVSHVAPASPLERIDFIERLSPHTPQDGMLPPDPSGLSISNSRDGQVLKSGAINASMPPPATPTTGREYFPMVGERRLSTTPISTFAPSEIDDSLTSRFEKVEMIGTGEFSRVYRVTQTSHPTANQSFYFGTGSPAQGGTPPTPMPERVFAVKKSRQPYQGTRDRQRKLQEVKVLKALGHSDHVVHLIDNWEEKNYLYIQTEFCEEGSLDLFLAQVGRKGRLDDFRIWKIMLELSLVSFYAAPSKSKLILKFRVSNIFMNMVISIWISNPPTFSSPSKVS
jgi:mitosis inhibitor protein kinase SWE1